MGLWSRATVAGAVAGAVAGSLAGLLGAVVPGWVTTGSAARGVWLATFPDAIPTLAPFLGALLASTVVAVAVSLAGRAVTDLSTLNARVPVLGGPEPCQGR